MLTNVKMVFVLSVLSLTVGCMPELFIPGQGTRPTSWEEGSFGGQDSVTVHMPFAAGVESQCVQGPNGSYSHQYDETRYDVDFDTPNNVDQKVFAPISGTAYVHLDLDSGFGIHVNIDLGDGTYIILAHLKKADWPNGQWVEMGEEIGVEGATGFATGDHVHMGRHHGDASRDGTKGKSVEGLNIRFEDVYYGTTLTLPVSEMSCGLVDGRVYGSLLPTDDDETGASDPSQDPSSGEDDQSDDPPLVEDGEILVCMDTSITASMTALKLYAIGESGAVQSDPFYEEGSEVIDIPEIPEDFAMSSEHCEVFDAMDDETVWVNGFAYLGPDPLVELIPEYWQHFVLPSGGIYGSIHTYADVNKTTPARACSTQSFLYYDVNAHGPTDYNDVQRAFHCPS